jgi:predicted HicB family RNase H-like nuclease
MILRHEGFIAIVEPEGDELFGRVINATGPITFYGRDLPQLKRELAASVQAYLDLCREKGIDPQKPYSGTFSLRLDPEAHAQLAHAAASRGKSMNAWAAEVLAAAAERELKRE